MEGTIIGFDFGSRRIGVAVGETSTRIASPLGAIEAEANEARFEAIGRIVDEWHPKGFVVGRLEARYGVPVQFVDETLTSAEAEASLKGMRTRAGTKSDVDALAAMLILQSYLDGMPPAGKEAR